MNKDFTVLWFSTIMILGYASGEKYKGVTIKKCYLDTETDSNDYALARVNGTLKERPPPNENDPNIYCEISDKNQVRRGVIGLELFIYGDTPSQFILQIADVFLQELESTNIACSYADIGPRHRVDTTAAKEITPTIGNWSYTCDGSSSLRIKFTGIDEQGTSHSESELRHDRTKRTAANKQIEIDKIRCFDGIYSDKSDGHKKFEMLGWGCAPQNDQIGKVWMFNATRLPDCLPCCVDYHWNNVTKQCEKCPPEGTQPVPNVWTRCEPIHSGEQTQSSIKPTTTKPKPEIHPPVESPTGLTVTRRSCHDVLIDWDETLSTEFAPVTVYKVIVENIAIEKQRVLQVTAPKTWINVTDLSPGSCYEVNVVAGNSKGFGPESDRLDVHTLRNLTTPEHVTYTIEGNHVNITWTPKPTDRDLTVKVDFWFVHARPDELQSFTKPFAGGQIDFNLTYPGRYEAWLFYIDEDLVGPKFKMPQLEYVKRFGPESDRLDVHTLRNLTTPEHVTYTIEGNHVNITWTPKPTDRDLTVKVDFRFVHARSGELQSVTKPFAGGQIDFNLTYPGRFDAWLFYIDEGLEGPKFKMPQLEYVKPPTGAMIGIAVFILLLPLLIYLFYHCVMKLRKKVKGQNSP